MKTTLITFLLICFNALSQNAGTFIFGTDNNMLYRDYLNPVEFGVTNGSHYRISLDGVKFFTDTSFFTDHTGKETYTLKFYLLPTSTGRYATVTLLIL